MKPLRFQAETIVGLYNPTQQMLKSEPGSKRHATS